MENTPKDGGTVEVEVIRRTTRHGSGGVVYDSALIARTDWGLAELDSYRTTNTLAPNYATFYVCDAKHTGTGSLHTVRARYRRGAEGGIDVTIIDSGMEDWYGKEHWGGGWSRAEAVKAAVAVCCEELDTELWVHGGRARKEGGVE